MSKKEKLFLVIFLVITTAFLTISCYYCGTRYVGDTALYAQIAKNIAYTGKAESNILANTLDFIERNIATIPVEERISREDAFTPPLNQTRNILGFHACFIFYLIAPLCYIMSEFTCVTLVQSMALVFSLFFCILVMRQKKVPYPLIVVVCILLTAHPGWSMPAIYGAFYPERIFMGTGMYLAWACEKKQFSRTHFIIATVLCMMVGERGALYAGMFILAYTVFYWKERVQGRILRLSFGSIAVLYAGIIMKYFLSNLYYSGLGSRLNLISYLSNPQNARKVILFFLINFCFYAVVAILDWRALVIGMASTIPNLLYDGGGAEKIGWTLHYHVFYFVFLMWAVSRGMTKMYEVTCKRRKTKVIPYFASIAAAIMVSLINPYDLNVKFSFSNVKNNVIINAGTRIKVDYLDGGAVLRQNFRQFVSENIPCYSKVTSIEGAFCELGMLSELQIYLYPMGFQDADYAVVAYQESGSVYKFSGAVTYVDGAEIFNEEVVEKMREYGYDLENPILFPSYGIAILKRTD